MSVNLPYAVIRGEEFGLQITIFNYESSELQVRKCSCCVTLPVLVANYNCQLSVFETLYIISVSSWRGSYLFFRVTEKKSKLKLGISKRNETSNDSFFSDVVQTLLFVE